MVIRGRKNQVESFKSWDLEEKVSNLLGGLESLVNGFEKELLVKPIPGELSREEERLSRRLAITKIGLSKSNNPGKEKVYGKNESAS